MEQRQPAAQSQRRQHQHPLRLRRARPAHQPHPGGRRSKTGNAMDPGHRPPLQRNRAGAKPPKRRRMARNALHAHPRWRRATHQRTKTRPNATRLRRRPRQREADIYDLKGWQHTTWHPKESAIPEKFRLSRMELNWLVMRRISFCVNVKWRAC